MLRVDPSAEADVEVHVQPDVVEAPAVHAGVVVPAVALVAEMVVEPYVELPVQTHALLDAENKMDTEVIAVPIVQEAVAVVVPVVIILAWENVQYPVLVVVMDVVNAEENVVPDVHRHVRVHVQIHVLMIVQVDAKPRVIQDAQAPVRILVQDHVQGHVIKTVHHVQAVLVLV